MSDQFLAEIRIVGFEFAPTGWATCDGQVLPIQQNTALFSLLGTNYGGNGTSNFALPNLQDSFAIGAGQGSGLTPRAPGETGGSASVTLLQSQMPQHAHGLLATAAATTGAPAGAALATTATGAAAYRIPSSTVSMAPDALGPAGGAQPHNNRQPYSGLMFCIAMQGIYPPRN
jgi:microcystin-dependent protein